MKRLVPGKYWPVALFVVSNVAAVTLVIKANSAYDAPPLADPALAERPWGDAPDLFEPLDRVDPARSGGEHAPLLFDWGNEFDLDQPDTPPATGGSFLDAARRRLDQLQREALAANRLAAREERERDLLRRPWNLNFYNREGTYLGRTSWLPPLDWNLPPLSPVSPLSLPGGGYGATVYGGPQQTLNVQVDPALFRDPQAMAAFVNELSRAAINAGIHPTVTIAPPTPDPGHPALPKADAPLPPVTPADRQAVAAAAFPGTGALPKPPADIVVGVAAPEFNPELVPDPGGGLDSLPTRVVDVTAAPPPQAERQPLGPGDGPARPPAPRPREEPRPLATEPLATERPADTGPRSAAPAPRAPAESRVAVRVTLAATPDRGSAERALARLQAAGLGGGLLKTADGLDNWIVHSKVFSTRAAATAALAKVREMGYEAWLN